jgi:hypothetical protein
MKMRQETARAIAEIQNLSERLNTTLQALKLESDPGYSLDEEEVAFLFRNRSEDRQQELLSKSRNALPDPRLVRLIIKQRRKRSMFFGGDLFAEPAWNILLDLTAARAEHTRVSVTSLCIASGVPPTTALRWINHMIAMGILQRVEDDSDRRRAFVALSPQAAASMARYFAAIDFPIPI